MPNIRIANFVAVAQEASRRGRTEIVDRALAQALSVQTGSFAEEARQQLIYHEEFRFKAAGAAERVAGGFMPEVPRRLQAVQQVLNVQRLQLGRNDRRRVVPFSAHAAVTFAAIVAATTSGKTARHGACMIAMRCKSIVRLPLDDVIPT